MCKKLILLTIVFLVLGTATQAGIYVWSGDAGDELWDTPGNWTVTDSNWIWPNEENAADPNLAKYTNADTLVIDIIAGIVSRVGPIAIQGAPDGSTTAVLTLSEGSSLTIEGRLATSTEEGNAGRGQIDILGGSTVTITGDGEDLTIADDNGNWGMLNVVDSTIVIPDDFRTDHGEAHVSISGSSTIECGDDFLISDNDASLSFVDIGGTAVIAPSDDFRTNRGESHVTIGDDAVIDCDDFSISGNEAGVSFLDIGGNATITIADDFDLDNGESTTTVGGNAVISFGDDGYVPDDDNAVATLTITDNAEFNVGDDITVADNAGSVGHMIITGNATVNAPDEFYLADDPTASAILDVNGTATLNVGDDLDVGEDGPAVCNIGENAVVTVGDTIYIPHNQHGIEASMTISGNATVSCDDLQVVNDGGNTGFLHISGNPTITMRLFYMNNDAGDPGTSEVIMDGGTVTVTEDATINDDNNGTATFTLNGGTFDVGDDLDVSDNLDGTGHLTINGGKVIVADEIRLGSSGGEDIGQSRVFLNGGLLQAKELRINITDSQIIAAGGTLMIGTEDVNEVEMQQLIDDGTIVADANDYFIVTDGDYTVLAAKAYAPTPGDYAAGVFPTPTITTYISDDVPKAIQDLQPTTPSNTLGRTTSLLTIADSVTIEDLNVELDIRMPGNNADLNVFLTSPDGKQVELFTDVGFNLDDFRNTILDDEASKSIRSGTQPFTGIFKPEGRLSDFDGRDTEGDWVLKIEDDWRGDVARLNSWQVVVQSAFVLGWKPAPDAASQNVYFSESLDDVSDRAEAALLDNVAGDAGSTGAPALGYDTTYYWAVDSLDPNGIAESGQVWTFTTGSPSEAAQAPSPADGAVDVVQDTLVSWQPGASAAGREVFFGTDEDPASVGLTTGLSYDPGKLVVTTTYYWKVDEIEADGTRLEGDVWSFTTVIGEAIDPDPADGAVGVPLDAVLSWTPGATAVSHDGYFGTEPDPPFLGNTTENSFDTALIGGLEMDMTYYWRLDAIEEDGTTHVGEVWTFKTPREGFGTILREVWEGIEGTAVSDLTSDPAYPDNPTFSEEVTSFEVPTDFADNFGSRVHGWLHPVTSGDYTFWIATDDNSELWLSTDENPANAVVVSEVTAWAPARAFDDPDVIPSDPIPLEGGKSYYISGIYKEGGGGDNLAVAWQGPDSPERAVISGFYLTPFVDLWAKAPDPADGSTLEQTFALLQWTAGVTAESQNVYVSDNMDDVAARAEAAFVGNQTGSDLSIGLPGTPFPDGLAGATYYWAIDAVEADPNVVFAGPVWSFTVPPVEAFDPSPADGAENVAVDVTLSWTAGLGAKLHSVYFGDDPDTVANAVGAPPLPMTTHSPGPLEAGKTYYWRVDEFNPPNNVTGAVWSFTTAP